MSTATPYNIPGVRLPPAVRAALERKRKRDQAKNAPAPTLALEVIKVPPAEPYVPTLEEFREQCELQFAWLRKRLTIRVHGADDIQQWEAAVRIVYEIGQLRRNVQVIAPTGQGKTYVCAAVLAMLAHFFPDEHDPLIAVQNGRFPPIVIQPPKVMYQCRRVLADFGVTLVNVCSAAALRTSMGQSMLEFRTVVVNQQPVLYPYWVGKPTSIWADESQQFKNDSTASDIIESAALTGIPVIPASATPYSRPCQARTISIVLRPQFGAGEFVSPRTWPSFVNVCCGSDSPEEWSPAALKRLQVYLEPQTVRWAIDYPHSVIVKEVGCDFPSAESAMRYETAFAHWQNVRMQRGKNPLVGMAEVLVAQAKFNQIAEEERVDPLVRYGVEFWLDMQKRGKCVNIIFAFAYRTAADKAWERLRAILGEREFARRCARVVGGEDSTVDVTKFQADSKQIMVLMISCGGAGLSLDHNPDNKNRRVIFTSIVYNDIQMAQLAGRTQRLYTRSPSYVYAMYFRGTEEQRKFKKVRRKIRSLREITTKIRSRTAATGEAGTFVEGIEEIESVDGGMLESGALPHDEGSEEMLAERLIGSTAGVTIEVREDHEELVIDV